MPLYEYRCLECGHVFEKLSQKPDEAMTCPACGSERVQRRISLFAAPTAGRSVGCAPAGG